MNGNGFGDEKSFLDNREFFEAAAGFAMIFAGASLLLANPNTRQYVKDGLRAFFPNTDLDKLDDPIAMGLTQFMPDIERYLRLKSM